MAAAALYNRWRSRTFSNRDDLPLIGQDHITRTLRNAVASGQISHAYLFCGPRGTGKTSAARILARAVNCKRGLQGEPCNACENCEALLSGRQLDLLIEIDGASNNGVDEVRELREKLMIRPGGDGLTGRYKVYIIDEVHMLSNAAFNALLKSLEEPPAHVIFILATTDPQKVPATVVSRCQRHDFRPIPLETLVRHLANVATSEGVELEPAALELLARTAAGGARDAVSLLDQALSFAGAVGDEGETSGPSKAGASKTGKKGKAQLRITAAQVQAMLGLTEAEAIYRLLDAVAERDLAAGLRLVHEVSSQGSDLRQFARQVIDLLRGALLVAGNAGELSTLDDESREQVRVRAERLGLAEVVRLIKLFTQAEHGLRAPSAQPQLPLELAVVEACLDEASEAGAPPVRPAAPAATAPRQAAPPAARSAPAARPAAAAPAQPARSVAEAPPAPVLAEPEEDDAPHPADVPWPPSEPEPVVETVLAEPAALAKTEAPAALTTKRALAEPPADAPASTGTAPATISIDLVVERWPAVIDHVRQASRGLSSRLEIAKPIAVEPGNVVIVGCAFKTHADKINEPASAFSVNRALTKVLGVRATVRSEVVNGSGKPSDKRRVLAPTDDPFVTKAAGVMNGRVMTPAELAAIEALPVTAEFEAGDL